MSSIVSGITKNNHATHEYSRDRLNGRREVALANLEGRLKLSNEQLMSTARRFKGRDEVSDEEMLQYKTYMKAAAELLKKRVKKAA